MPLKIRKRGAIWHYAGTVAGRRIRGTTGTADKETAQRIAAETESREWKRHLDGPGAHLTMAHAFLLYREAEKSDRFLVPLEDHFKNTPVREVTGETIRQVARKLYPGLSPATLNRQAIVPCMAAINHAAELGLCPRIKVKRLPENPKRKEAATQKWVIAFASQATADGLIHLAALCLFMFATAARIGEACRLTWNDVDLSDARVTIRMGKPCLMTSLGSFAIKEPLPGTAYMPGSGGGRIEGNQVLHHRGVV